MFADVRWVGFHPPFKNYLFSAVEVLAKSGATVGLFCMNGSEQNETKRHFVLKKALLFCLNPSLHHFE